MPATRTNSAILRERRKHDPYSDVEVRQHPKGPLMYKTLDHVPHKYVDARLFGKAFRKSYSHLGQPEVRDVLPDWILLTN